MSNTNEKPVFENIPKQTRSKFCDAADGSISPQQAAANAECRYPKAPRVEASDWEHGIGLN